MAYGEGEKFGHEEVINFLDVQIAHYRDQSKRDGWPRWGIVLACGGIAWKLLDLMTSGGWSLAGSAQVVLFGAGAWKVATVIRDWVESLGRNAPGPHRFHWTLGLLEGPRLWLVLRLGIAAGLLVLVMVVWPRTTWIGRVVPLMLVVGEALPALGVIAMLRSRRDLPVFRGMGAAAPFRLAAVLDVMLGAALAWAFRLPAIRGYAVDQQAGALTLVLAYLFLRYANQLIGNPLLESLEDTRRQLALHKVLPAHAMQQAEAIIEGLPLEGLFGKELAEVLAHEQSRNAAQAKARAALASLREAVDMRQEPADLEKRLADLVDATSQLDAAGEKLATARKALQGKYDVASRLLPAFGVPLPTEVAMSVLDRLLDGGVDLALPLEVAQSTMNAGAVLASESRRLEP